MKRAYSVHEFAKVTGVLPGTVYEAIKRNEIPSIKIGRRIIIPANVVDNLLMCGLSLKQAVSGKGK